MTASGVEGARVAGASGRGSSRQLRRTDTEMSVVPRSCCGWACLVGILTSACGSAEPRYHVTERPLACGDGLVLCVAIDPRDAQGVWWWEPGASGCDSYSTGPGVFPGDQASVSVPQPDGQISVSFRLPIHATSEPYHRELRLLVHGDSIRVAGDDASTRLQRRSNLILAEEPKRGSR